MLARMIATAAHACAACAAALEGRCAAIPVTALMPGMSYPGSLVTAVRVTAAGRVVVTSRPLAGSGAERSERQRPGGMRHVACDGEGRPLIHWLHAHGL
jgi:hypothetical protein